MCQNRAETRISKYHRQNHIGQRKIPDNALKDCELSKLWVGPQIMPRPCCLQLESGMSQNLDIWTWKHYRKSFYCAERGRASCVGNWSKEWVIRTIPCPEGSSMELMWQGITGRINKQPEACLTHPAIGNLSTGESLITASSINLENT